MIYIYRAAHLSPDQQTQIGRRLLRYGLSSMGIHRYQIEREGIRRPFLAGEGAPFFSITHTQGLVACAICSQNMAIDAEFVCENYPLRVARRVCTPRELAAIASAEDFYALWTLKEAYAKATGEGLALDFRKAEFDLSKRTCSIGNFHYYQYKIDGCILSAAWLGTQPPSIEFVDRLD